MKSKRQSAILEIIDKNDIETQEELIECLKNEGLNVTQATISRDIRELRLTKVNSESGKYKYVRPGAGSRRDNENLGFYGNSISGSVISVDNALNLVVVKTYPGMAQAVAACMDTHSISGVMGCVAGDDTIFVAIKTVEGALSAARDIKKILGV